VPGGIDNRSVVIEDTLLIFHTYQTATVGAGKELDQKQAGSRKYLPVIEIFGGIVEFHGAE
jgi:hypothetical protein